MVTMANASVADVAQDMNELHDGGPNLYADSLWEKTGGDDLLKGHVNFQDLFDSLPGSEKAVESIPNAPLYLLCIDDRLPGISCLSSSASYAHMAGEGILNPNALRDLQNIGLRGFIVHKNCGAKALYCKTHAIESGFDEEGTKAVYKLADSMKLPVAQIVNEQDIEKTHIARVVYYDGTGKFDWSRVKGLPPGFIISRKIISDSSYAQMEANIAVEIAKGNHGFGNRFNDQSPLYVVAVTDGNQDSVGVEVLMQELRDALNGEPYISLDSISIYGEHKNS